MKRVRRVLPVLCHFLYLAALGMCAPQAGAGEQPRRVSAQQFRDDVSFVRAAIARLHPDPGFSADRRALAAALDRATTDLPPSLDVDEAWQRLASVNSLLADGHFFIGYQDWRAELRTWLDAGGSLFPVEVDIGEDGALLMLSDAPSTAPVRIVSVNGVDADVLVAMLSSKVHGDTPGFRARLLAARWAMFYWKAFGAPEHYRLVLDQAGARSAVVLPASRVPPRVLRDEERPQFRLVIEADGSAVLTVDSFNRPDPAPFLDFTRAAFTRLRDEGVTRLVIDISRNGGGDDVMWLDGLMPYLATRPYRTGSTNLFLPRVQASRRSVAAAGEIATWRPPQNDNPLRFGGKVEVRIGPGTYSSAVLFANVMRDFGFGTLVGSGGWARQTQSGGLRHVLLPHTGLALWVPRFILDPPSGRAPGALLVVQDSVAAD